MPIGLVTSSFTLDVLPFLFVLSAKISMSSAMTQEFGTVPFSLKKFFMVAMLPQALEQESKECNALDPLTFHLTRPSAKEKSTKYDAFLIPSRCSISMQME